MSIPNNQLPEIPPTHPGEMLREDFMQDYNLSASTLAECLCVTKNIIGMKKGELVQIWL